MPRSLCALTWLGIRLYKTHVKVDLWTIRLVGILRSRSSQRRLVEFGRCAEVPLIVFRRCCLLRRSRRSAMHE